jgi:predicted neutral ceramidase superfamily lipid hydrolase
MSKSERVMALAVTLVAVLFLETIIMVVWGMSSHHIFWAVFTQTVFAMFLMALADPTYKRGYIFAIIVSLAAFAFLLGHKPSMVPEGFLLSVSCVGTTWGTYEARRRWNWRRVRERSYD